jgi:hypothetical protein
MAIAIDSQQRSSAAVSCAIRASIRATDMRARRWRCAAAVAASELHALQPVSRLATPKRPRSLRTGNWSSFFRTWHTQQIVRGASPNQSRLVARLARAAAGHDRTYIR